MAPYFAEYPSVGTGAEARGSALFQVTEQPGRWRVRQVLDDPDANHDWAVAFEVDLAGSDAEGRAILRTVGLERL